MVIDVIALVDIIQANECKVRLKIKGISAPEIWTNGALTPTAGYIELNGPWPISQVEWVEINPVVTEQVGRLIAPKQVNSLTQIELGLCQASISYGVSDGIIRIPF